MASDRRARAPLLLVGGALLFFFVLDWQAYTWLGGVKNVALFGGKIASSWALEGIEALLLGGMLLVWWKGDLEQGATWALTLLFVGGGSNLLQRLLFGGVLDWIPYPWGVWGNGSDILITGGSILLLFSLFRH